METSKGEIMIENDPSNNTTNNLENQIDIANFNFKTIKIDQPLDEYLSSKYCEVCFRFHDNKTKRKQAINDPGNEFIICYGCGITTHLYCYGIKTKFNRVRIDDHEEIFMFVCDRCKINGPDFHVECSVCFKRDGAIKHTQSDDWVHILCALFSDLYEIDSYETMEISSRSRNDKRVPKTGKRCYYCHAHGNLLKCGYQDCDHYIHIYCALKNKIPYIVEDEDAVECWKFKMLTYPGSGQGPKINFDENEPRILQGMNIILKKCVEFLMGERPTTENESNNLGKNQQNKRKARQPKKKVANKDKEIKEIIDQHQDKLTEIHKRLNEEMNNYFKNTGGLLLVNNNLKEQVYKGGKLILECMDHRSIDLFCTCNKPYDYVPADAIWVGCDGCDSWYHNTCIGLSAENFENITFFCEKCKKWAKHKQLNLTSPNMKMMEPLHGIQLPLTNETIDQLKVIPKDTNSFKLSDFITLQIIFEKKLNAIIKLTDSDSNYMGQITETARYLPLSITGVLHAIYRKVFLGQITDESINLLDLIEKQGDALSSFDPINKQFNQDNLAKNEDSISYFKSLLTLYSPDIIGDTPTKKLIYHKIQILEFIIDFYQNYIYNQNLSFTYLQDLRNQAHKLNLDPHYYGERNYLDQQYESAKTWHEESATILANQDQNFQYLFDHIFQITASNIGHTSQNVTASVVEKLNYEISKMYTIWDDKPKITFVEHLIEKGRESPVDFSMEITKLESEIKKAENWSQKFNELQQHKNYSILQLQELIESLADVHLNIPKIKETLQLYFRAKVAQIILEIFVKQIKDRMDIEELQNANNKEGDDEGTTVASNNTQQQQQNLINYQEAQQLVKEIDSLNIDFGDNYKQFKDLLINTQKFQYKLDDNLSGQIDPATLKVLDKESKAIYFDIPSLKILNKRVELYKDLKQHSNRKISTIDQLKEKIGQAKENFKDNKLIQELQIKLDKAIDIQTKIDNVLLKNEYNEKDVTDTIPNLINEIKAIKIDLSQKNTLISIQKTYKWLEKFYTFYTTIASNSAGYTQGSTNGTNEMEIETSKPENMDNISIMIDKIANAKPIVNNINKAANQLRTLIKEAQQYEIKDYRIKELFIKFGQILWIHDVNTLIKTNQINPQELENLKELGKSFDLDKLEDNETYIKFMDIYQKYHDWKERYDDIVNTDSLKRILIEASDEDIKQNIQKLVEDYLFLQVNQEESLKKLKNSLNWVDWARRALTLLESIDKPNGKLSFDSLQDLYSYANLINLPKDSSIYEKLVKYYTDLKIIRDKYDEFISMKRTAYEKIKQFTEQESNIKSRKKELYDLNKSKPTLSHAKEIYSIVISSPLNVDPSEINELEQDISQCENWYSRVTQFMGENMLNAAPIQDNIDQISQSLNQLRSEMVSLPFQVENGDQEMYAYEWTFHALVLLNSGRANNTTSGNITAAQRKSKNSDIKDWTKMIKYAQNLKNSKLMESQFYKSIQEQINIYQRIGDEVAQIKQREDDLNSVNAKSNTIGSNGNLKGGDPFANLRKDLKTQNDIKSILNSLQNCKVDTIEEKKYLDELLNRSKKIEDSYKELIQTEGKGSLTAYHSLLKIIKRIPIAFVEEEANLEKDIQKAKMLQKSIDDSKKSPKVDIKVIEFIVNQYTDCPILISEAAQITQNYQESIKIFNEIEEYINDNTKIKTFDDIITKLRAFDEIKIHLGPKLEDLRVKLYQQKVEHMKNFATQVEKPTIPLSFGFIKNTLLEGYSLLMEKENINKLKESIQIMEGLVDEVENNLRHIYAIKDLTLLEEINHIIHNFIDLREEIIDYKAQLALYPNFKTNFESVVKNVYQQCNNDEEKIINMCKTITQNHYKSSSSSISASNINKIDEKHQHGDSNKTKGEEPKKKKEKKLAEKIGLKSSTDGEDDSPLLPNYGHKTGETKTSKRKQKPAKTNDDFIYGHDLVPHGLGSSSGGGGGSGIVQESESNTEDMLKNNKLGVKKMKIEKPAPNSETQIITKPAQVQPTNSQKKTQKVSEDLRQDARVRIMNSLKENSNFAEYAEDHKTYARNIEVHLFSDFHEDSNKYLAHVKIISNLLFNLSLYKNLSKLTADKSFEFGTLMKLARNKDKLDVLEKQAMDKLKTKHQPLVKKSEQKQQQQTPTKVLNKPTNTNKKEDDDKNAIDNPISSLLFSQPNETTNEYSRLKSLLSTSQQLPSTTQQNQLKKTKKESVSVYEAISSDEDKNNKNATSKASTQNPDYDNASFSDTEPEQTTMKNELELMANKNASPTYNLGFIEETSNTTKSKMFGAILYDPESGTTGEDQGSQVYDPFKTYTPSSSSNTAMIDESDYPKGSILRVFKGKLKHSVSKSMHLSVRSVSLYTCEESKHIKTFPKIMENTLRFTGRVAKKEALDYLEKIISNKAKKRQILTGWIISEKGENQESLDKIGDDLLQNDKAGALKYSEYAGIYFFHIKQIKNELVQKFDIKIKTISNQPTAKPVLLFAIYLRTVYIPNYMAPCIDPELIELATDTGEKNDTQQISQILQDDMMKYPKKSINSEGDNSQTAILDLTNKSQTKADIPQEPQLISQVQKGPAFINNIISEDQAMIGEMKTKEVAPFSPVTSDEEESEENFSEIIDFIKNGTEIEVENPQSQEKEVEYQHRIEEEKPIMGSIPIVPQNQQQQQQQQMAQPNLLNKLPSGVTSQGQAGLQPQIIAQPIHPSQVILPQQALAQGQQQPIAAGNVGGNIQPMQLGNVTQPSQANIIPQPVKVTESKDLVEQLQKMSKEELMEFVEKTSEEDKEKIIRILNSYVEHDKIDEEKIPDVSAQEQHMAMNPNIQQPYPSQMMPGAQYYPNQMQMIAPNKMMNYPHQTMPMQQIRPQQYPMGMINQTVYPMGMRSQSPMSHSGPTPHTSGSFRSNQGPVRGGGTGATGTGGTGGYHSGSSGGGSNGPRNKMNYGGPNNNNNTNNSGNQIGMMGYSHHGGSSGNQTKSYEGGSRQSRFSGAGSGYNKGYSSGYNNQGHGSDRHQN